jgi:hypothetical protein
MLKHIYRVIILIAVFVASLYFFSKDIKEVVFERDNTTRMKDVTFPLVTIKTGGNTVNMLHGYGNNMDANKIREVVTPLGTDKTFEVQFNKKDLEIKKLNYEVREFSGNALIESDSISVFEENGDLQTAKIKLNADLTAGKEYAVKITLITNKTEKIYYYHRIKLYEQSHLPEKLNFVMDFHNAIMNKSKAQDIIKYLEPSNTADNSTLAYVNINSSFDLVSWGSLHPTVITDIVPTVREIYEDTASVELNYYIKAEVARNTETYKVTEFYRVRYAPDRMYLLNYERHMESLFDINLASISKSELKLGITSDSEVPYKAGADNTKLAFVRSGELWFYDMGNNEITRVFSFRQQKSDYLRDLYDQHNIRIINMDAEGNLDFMVYGYMNRGQYEGRVGIILYHYLRAENRIEELVYIPVDEPYQRLKENLGDLAYLNSKDIFYIQVYDTIYAYNLITRKLSETAASVNKKQVMVLKDLNYVAWQEDADPKRSNNIYIMNLETGEKDTISSKTGYKIRLMDMIDSNIIYGFVNDKDISSTVDGSIIAPLNRLEIAASDKSILKSYSRSGIYFTNVSVKDNVIELKCVKKSEENGKTIFAPAADDQIMNRKAAQTSFIGITSRVTDKTLTEYYMALPAGFVMKSLPKVSTTVNTVITQDPTVRLPKTQSKQLYYYPYITGGIAGAYENAAAAIEVARNGIGVVLNSKEQLVWERGVKSAGAEITQMKDMTWTPSSKDNVIECVRLVLACQGAAADMAQLSNKSSAYDAFKAYSKYTPVRLTGSTLDDVLYYVSVGRPVIAMTDSHNAVIIYGYDAFNIMILDPSKGSVSKMGLQDSTKLFENAGNVFLSYLGQ